MKIRLLDFQEVKASELVRKTISAQRILQDDENQTQSVLLSSPTGSGKTVIMVSALEALVEGDEERLANPLATILWLSDSPELNEQSKQKFLSCSSVFTSGRLQTIDNSFDRRVLDPGKVYFINTQKFAVSANLTKGQTDFRRNSIWQTIANTIDERKENFILVIDEAHKGLVAQGSPGERNEAKTIPQKFLLGFEGQLPPVPLVLGISATPKRFADMLERSERTAHRVVVDPDVVRRSGLLKHRLLIHSPAMREKHVDFTLLREAVRHHVSIKANWREYCQANKEPLVTPLLVLQVEDGDTTRDLFSRTDLDRLIRSVREELPELDPAAICHCFQDDAPLKADGIRIRRVEPSKLQDEDGLFPAEVVLFKTALTTGWDCPRAETMMSFRTARDATMIEQLIGRMVRAPLARSVESNDALNTVRLFLPGFDRTAVQAIIMKLSDPASDDSIVTEADLADNFVLYERALEAAPIFEQHPHFPTYVVPRRNQQPPLVRLLKLVNRLSITTNIDPDAAERITDELVGLLVHNAEAKIDNPAFRAAVSQATEIRVEGHVFDLLANRYRSVDRETILASDESVDDVFRAASRSLTGDSAVGIAFWKTRDHPDDPRRAKLEFVALATDQSVRGELNRWAASRLDELYAANLTSIMSLPPARRSDIQRLAGGQDAPMLSAFSFKDKIEVRRGSVPHRQHIYSDPDGDFAPVPLLNGWENAALVQEELRQGFLGWFRNPVAGEERLAIPYKDTAGTWRSKSPDFLVFHREVDGRIHCALIEPHDISDDESFLIAKGLAEFASAFESTFSRVELTLQFDHEVKRLDLAKPSVRREVLAINSNDALRRLFKTI